MEGWLPNAERVNNSKALGGTYLPNVPWRFVTHTTEAIPSTVNGARAMASRHEYPPHLWAWPAKNWLGQTVVLDRSAFALKHPSGTPETNKMRALQVEIIGKAAETPNWPDEWWDWLGVNVLRPIINLGYTVNLNHVAPTTGQDGAGTGGRVRMTRAQWAVFDGVCCHANVPDNSHWDIGKGDLVRLAQAAKPALPIPTPDPGEDDEMTPHFIRVGTDEFAVFVWIDGRLFERGSPEMTDSQAGALKAVYVVKVANAAQVNIVQQWIKNISV